MKIMSFLNRVFLGVFAVATCFGVTQCGSGAISTSTSPTTSVSEAAAEDMAQSMVGSTASVTTTATALVVTLAPTPALKKIAAATIGPTACTASGTQTYEYDFTASVISMTWTYDACDFGYGFIFDGSMSVTGESNGTTVDGTIGFDDYSYDDGSTSFTVDGVIDFAWDDSTQLVTATYDLTSTEGTNELGLAGSLTLDLNHVANGTITVTYNALTFTCTVTDLDLDTAEEDDFTEACSATL